MNRHVAFAQAQASVNKLDEQFSRRLFGMAFETLGKPLVKGPRQARRARFAGCARTRKSSH